jgi:MFS family permease
MSDDPASPSHGTSTPLPSLSSAERRAYARNLPKYYLFVFLSEAQLWFPIWIAFLLLDRGLSLTEIAIIDAPFWLLVVLAEVPTGAVADRWGRAISLSLGATVYAISLIAFAFAPTLPWIMATYMVWAVALTLTSGADSALVYDTLKVLGREREYERFAGRGMAVRSVALVIAVFAGGPLVAATTFQTPMFIGAGFLVAAALVAMTFKEPPRLEIGSQLSYIHGVRAAFRTVWRHPQLRTLIPFAAVIMAGTMATEYLTQPFLLSHDIDVGFAFSGLQVPIRITGVIGALIAFTVVARMGEVRTLLALPVIGVVGYVGLALWDALGAIVLLALLGFVRSFAFPVVTGYINRRIPSDQRATVLSLNQVAFSLILAPMVPALGISADKIDLPTGFAVAAGILAVLALITGIAWARTHRHPSGPTPSLAQVVPPPHPALGVVARAKAQRAGASPRPQPALGGSASILPQDAAAGD